MPAPGAGAGLEEVEGEGLDGWALGEGDGSAGGEGSTAGGGQAANTAAHCGEVGSSTVSEAWAWAQRFVVTVEEPALVTAKTTVLPATRCDAVQKGGGRILAQGLRCGPLAACAHQW